MYIIKPAAMLYLKKGDKIMIKKTFLMLLTLSLCMLLFILTGCGGSNSKGGSSNNGGGGNDDDIINPPPKIYAVNDGRGNSMANISNGGFVAVDHSTRTMELTDKWIYYTIHDKRHMYKVKQNGTGRTLLSSSYCTYLNVLDGWIYYCTGSGIYKMKTDGTERQYLCNGSFDLSVVGEWMYYTTRNGIYKAKAEDGSSVTQLSNDQDVGQLFVGNDGWLYYTYNWAIYKIQTDGSNKTLIIDNKCYFMTMENSMIYYVRYENSGVIGSFVTYELRRVTTNGSYDEVVISKDAYLSIYRPLFYQNAIYFIDGGLLSGKIYRVNTNGSGLNLTTTNVHYYYGLNIIDGWVYHYGYTDSGTSTNGLYRVRTDGTGKAKFE